MTTNGSESLNNVFKQSRMLPVVSLVEDTFYKLNAWFVERHAKATALASRDQTFSDRVEETYFFWCSTIMETAARIKAIPITDLI